MLHGVLRQHYWWMRGARGIDKWLDLVLKRRGGKEFNKVKPLVRSKGTSTGMA